MNLSSNKIKLPKNLPSHPQPNLDVNPYPIVHNSLPFAECLPFYIRMLMQFSIKSALKLKKLKDRNSIEYKLFDLFYCLSPATAYNRENRDI